MALLPNMWQQLLDDSYQPTNYTISGSLVGEAANEQDWLLFALFQAITNQVNSTYCIGEWSELSEVQYLVHMYVYCMANASN